MLWLAGRVAVEVDNRGSAPWAGFQSAPVGMGPNHGQLAVGLSSGVVRHWLSPVRCGRDCPSAHVELAEGDERPGQEAVRERWREDEERSSSERDRDRRSA